MFIRKLTKIEISEKRREARYPVEAEAIIFCGGEFVTTRTLNISSSGLQLETPLPESFVGKTLEIQVAPDLDKPKKFELFYGMSVDTNRTRIEFRKEHMRKLRAT